jgi:hypothetical protein
VAQAGQPYSLLLGGDPNRDGSSNNDLLFIPTNLILCPSTSNAAPNATAPCRTATATQTPLPTSTWNTFLESVGYTPGSGEAPERNSLRQPWTRRLDFHYELGLPQIYGSRISIQADVLNVLHLFAKDVGVQRFVLNNTYQPVIYSGQDPTTGLPVYREAATSRLTPGNQFSTANIGSRWQGRLGVRISF